MVKLQKQLLQKNCFGTKEWSNNSGICNGCEQKDACGKVKTKRTNPPIPLKTQTSHIK